MTNHIETPRSTRTVSKRASTRLRFPLLALTVGVSLLAPQRVRAAAGALDATFGNGGTLLTDFANTSDYGFAVRVQPDGKIVVAGQSLADPLVHSVLARYNQDGSLDQTFGTGGKVIAPLDPD